MLGIGVHAMRARGSCFLALASALPPRTRIAEQRRSTMAVASFAGRSLSVKCPTQSDTLALGAALASVAKAGDVVLLRGDYGAGKTCLARGFLRAWFDDPDELVTSPSYLIDNVYPDDEGRALQPGVTVHHMDLWRLPEGKAAQLIDLERVFVDCISLVEWPDRLGEALPAEHLAVHLAIKGQEGNDRSAVDATEELEELEEPRVATLTAIGASWESRLRSEFLVGWPRSEVDR